MEHFKTIFDTKGEEFIDKLLTCHVDVSWKVDGSAIQAVNTGGTVSYCKRSGTPDMAGPVIDELTLATNRIYLGPVTWLKTKEDIIKKYAMCVFEILGGPVKSHIHYDKDPEHGMVILYAIGLNGSVITGDSLDTIAKELEVTPFPGLFSGMLSDSQKSELKSFLQAGKKDVSLAEFVVKLLAPDVSDAFLQNGLKQNIEGFVFTFSLNNGTYSCKMVDDAFRDTILSETGSGQGRDETDDECRMCQWLIAPGEQTGTEANGSVLNILCTVFSDLVNRLDHSEIKGIEADAAKLSVPEFMLINTDMVKSYLTGTARQLVTGDTLWQRILTVWIGVMRPKKRFAPRFSAECVSYIKSVQEQIF